MFLHCFTLLFEGSFPGTSPQGGLYLEGRFNGGFFLRYQFGGLIFGILRYSVQAKPLEKNS